MNVTKEYKKNPKRFVPFDLIITIETRQELDQLVMSTGKSAGIPFSIYDALFTEQTKLQS